jgi:hypothetical protein
MKKCPPGVPCFSYGVVSYPQNCGLINISSNTSDNVYYTGPNLPCINVNTCDSLSEAIVKINNSVCPEELTRRFLLHIQSNNLTFCQIVNNCI